MRATLSTFEHQRYTVTDPRRVISVRLGTIVTTTPNGAVVDWDIKRVYTQERVEKLMYSRHPLLALLRRDFSLTGDRPGV